MSDLDPLYVTSDADFIQALLVGVLVKLGGSIEFEPGDLAPDILGNTASGLLHRPLLEPLEGGRARLVITAAPTDDAPEATENL